jgi:serine/threonine protein kinase
VSNCSRICDAPAEPGRQPSIMMDAATPEPEHVSGTTTAPERASPSPSARRVDAPHAEERPPGEDKPSDVLPAASAAANDEHLDSTPKSEAPSTVETPVASTDTMEQSFSQSRNPEPSYFSPIPMRYQPSHLPVPEDAAPVVTPRSKSAGYTPSGIRIAQSGHPLTPEPVLAPAHAGERPGVHRDWSDTSTLSTASTIRANDINSFLQLSQSRSRETNYPNQAYSALQAQYHAPAYSPHFLRNRNSHPANHTLFSSQSETSSPAQEDHSVAAEPTSVVHSTASSPGLFTPTSSPHRTGFTAADLEGTYSGPWLHHTHRQAPKETHVADVEVDPISGRKIINQYEIIDELGRGVHGKVKLGRDLNKNIFVAIKIVERYTKRKRLGKNNSHEAKIKKEIAILKKARHPNIVGLLEVIDDPNMKKVYIVLEHVEMGEVRWRTDGAKEITLVEYRRCQREAEGIFENDAADIEDEHILQAAQQRLKREEKRQWKETRKNRLSGQATESWSLEYGDEEEDDFSSPNVSRVASATTALSDIQRSHFDTHTTSLADQGPTHAPELPSLTEGEVCDDTTASHDFPQSPERDFVEMANNTGLEGTMYGAYDSSDLNRGRAPSVADSTGSIPWEQDYEEQIPEHFRFVPTLTIDEARRAFRDTVLGLEYLHYQGVIHRDIKPANLLQARDHHIKISDFGVSYLGKEKDDEYPVVEEHSESDKHDIYVSVELAKTVGTPAFYAPELCSTDFDPDAPPLQVTNQIDIWALGVTLYCLVFGRVPFHAHNTFVLMRQIAAQEVYIPKKRLKAVEPQGGSRPSSHSRLWQTSTTSNKRLSHEPAYEDVDDELTDLLRRMLTKDPKERITLFEVKHHSWVVHGIMDKVRWLEETDPSSMTSGRKIEVSKEDVDVAVVPLTSIERIKSVARRGFEKLGVTFGMTKNQSRRRAKSTATAASGELSQPTSTASSSSTISQDARRQERRRPSLRPEESIFSALKASRDGEHPLSQSVTASPELRDHPAFLFGPQDGPDSRPESPLSMASHSSRKRVQSSTEQRPAGLERAQSTVSGTSSIRTIRPGDLGLATGASTLPALPSTPLEMPPNSNIGGIWRGRKQMLRKMRSRDYTGILGRASPVDRLLAGSDDAHGEPSLAFSNALAAGHVNPPACLMEGSTTGSSANASPMSSRAPSVSSHMQSVASPEHLRADYTSAEEGGLSRNSSLSSISSRLLYQSVVRADLPHVAAQTSYLPLLGETSEEIHSRPNPDPGRTDDALFFKARDEQIRKRILEQEQKDRPASSLSHGRSESGFSQEACPPSPDDETFYRREQEEAMHLSPLDPLPGPTMLTGYPLYEQQPLVSSSSEDRFTAMSQSTSNPSIPSVISANSSMPADDELHASAQKFQGSMGNNNNNNNESFLPILSLENAEDFNYDGDHAIESDEESEDSFIEMTRHRSQAQGLSRSESISNGELALHRARRATNGTSSVKSIRSGSNNTMKKIRSRDDSDDEHEERGRSRPLSAG